jgi:hypothetical protein
MVQAQAATMRLPPRSSSRIEPFELIPLMEDSDDFDNDEDCGPPMTHLWADAHRPTFAHRPIRQSIRQKPGIRQSIPKPLNEHSPEALNVAGYMWAR